MHLKVKKILRIFLKKFCEYGRGPFKTGVRETSQEWQKLNSEPVLPKFIVELLL
jgi:hypothetical protein